MDVQEQTAAIEERLAVLASMPVNDDQSARVAFAHLNTTVSRVNHLSAQVQAQALMGAVGAPLDAILAKLSEWVNRFITALTTIVANLDKAASFSISVGSTISVTVVFAR
jgi:hypothetical protein